MSNPAEQIKVDCFIDWLEKPPYEYSKEELDKLWEEFGEIYPCIEEDLNGEDY